MGGFEWGANSRVEERGEKQGVDKLRSIMKAMVANHLRVKGTDEAF